MLRILGGSLRGKKLFGPEGLEFRPTTGRVKEFIFYVYRQEIENSIILDLFSGSGSLGLEALSRGARDVYFVEKSFRSLQLLKRNIDACGFSGRAHPIAGDAFMILDRLGNRGEAFPVIFADPPFKESLHSRIVDSVSRNKVLKSGGVLILEHESHDACSGQPDLVLLRQKKFGHCSISIYGHGGAA
jgi:16S rRNA (guanine966-N2)-methyltransferase